MTNANDVRHAHELLDHIANGYKANAEEVDRIRKFLPERPKDVTLDDLLTRVHDAWMKANPSDWGFDTPAEHHDWLFDLCNDLLRILQEQDTPAAVTELPAGMRLADHEQYGRVVTSPKPNRDGVYDLLVPRPKFETGADWEYAHECELTFIDAEPAKPVHPEFLETEADYENAPEGTIVVMDGIKAPVLRASDWPMTMSHVRRRVLRWGWGE